MSMRSLVGLLAALGAATGCRVGVGGGADGVEHPCAPNQRGRPLGAPTLTAIADAHRDTALRKLARDESAGEELQIATACYAAAQSLAPDSYAANLGLGVTYLARAKSIRRPTNDARRSYLKAAKRALGQAYMVRQGPYDPLYYLAEVAALEDDRTQAEAFLAPVEQAGVKTSPVYALKGYLAFHGSRAEAEEHWRKALEAGWPQETLRYAAHPEEGRPGVAPLIAGSILVASAFGLLTAGGALESAESGAAIPLFAVGATAGSVGIPLLIHGAAQRSIESDGSVELLASSAVLVVASPALMAAAAEVASEPDTEASSALLGALGGTAGVVGIPLLVHGAVQVASGGEGRPGVANLIGGSILAASVPAFVVPGVVVPGTAQAPLVSTGATAGVVGVILLIQGAVEMASGEDDTARSRAVPRPVVAGGTAGLGWEL